MLQVTKICHLYGPLLEGSKHLVNWAWLVNFSYNQYDGRLDKVFDDWDNTNEIITRYDNEPHVKVDNMVFKTAISPNVKAAVAAPAIIYGKGK